MTCRERLFEQDVKHFELRMKEHLRQKTQEARMIFDRVGAATRTGLLASILWAWQCSVIEGRKLQSIQNQVTEASQEVDGLKMRQSTAICNVQMRSEKLMDSSLVISVISAWSRETKENHLEKFYSNKVDSKRKQLTAVQTLFKSFARDLEEIMPEPPDLPCNANAVTYADGDQEDWPIDAKLLASARVSALGRMQMPQQLSGLQLQRPSFLFPGLKARPFWPRENFPKDRKGLPPTAPEDTASVEESVHNLVKLLDKVRADGVPSNRIVIGGFSMGGGIALQLALRYPTKIAAAFVLSSFMCDDAAAYALLQTPPSVDVPILMMHGEADWFIRPVWGRATATRLKDAGLNVDFVSIPGLRHEISRKDCPSRHYPPYKHHDIPLRRSPFSEIGSGICSSCESTNADKAAKKGTDAGRGDAAFTACLRIAPATPGSQDESVHVRSAEHTQPHLHQCLRFCNTIAA
eukprot:s2365_g8.t2